MCCFSSDPMSQTKRTCVTERCVLLFLLRSIVLVFQQPVTQICSSKIESVLVEDYMELYTERTELRMLAVIK